MLGMEMDMTKEQVDAAFEDWKTAALRMRKHDAAERVYLEQLWQRYVRLDDAFEEQCRAETR